MANEVREFAILIPAGTPLTAPVTTHLNFPQRLVESVTWRVPPGPAGHMGWALTSDGTPVIPVEQGRYIVADDQADTWQLSGYLDSGRWAVTGYNTGTYDHTVYLNFRLNYITPATSAAAVAAGLSSGLAGLTGTVGPS